MQGLEHEGTGFEKRRGVSRIEVRHGYAQVHVSRLSEPIMERRLEALSAIANADISIDFLKFTPSGLSCLIAESLAEKAKSALELTADHYSVRPGRSVVLAHAVNMRDEEGLIAKCVHQAILSGARIDHVSDMHDRVLIVVHSEDAEPLRVRLERELSEESAEGLR